MIHPKQNNFRNTKLKTLGKKSLQEMNQRPETRAWVKKISCSGLGSCERAPILRRNCPFCNKIRYSQLYQTHPELIYSQIPTNPKRLSRDTSLDKRILYQNQGTPPPPAKLQPPTPSLLLKHCIDNTQQLKKGNQGD